MIAGLRCDVLVMGHGAAGCLAAATLAGKGLDVVLVGRGTTATELSTARIALPEGQEMAVLLRSMGREHGLYSAPAGRMKAITNAGTIAFQDLTSLHDWLVLPDDRVAVLGLRGNEDLDPDLACRSLACRVPSLKCEPYWADPGIPAAVDAGRDGMLSQEARRAIDVLSGVLSELRQETVVLPPLFAGPLYEQALAKLEAASGRRVREPATPLSNPGRRLQACLVEHAVRSGCRFLGERGVRSMTFDGPRASSAVVSSGLRELTISFRASLLATGGVVGGGLTVSGEEVIDPLGAFAVEGPRGPPLTRVLSSGVPHYEGHAIRNDGTVASNVMVAGASLPGMSFPLGRGLGDVMASALDTAQRMSEEL